MEGQSRQNHMLPVVLSFSREGEDEGAESHAQGPQITKPGWKSGGRPGFTVTRFSSTLKEA